MENKQILLLRNQLFEKLKSYEGKPLLLDYPEDILRDLFFSYDEKKDSYRFISEYFTNGEVRDLMKKIDFSNVSFDRFRFIKTLGMDFTGFTGIKINPQTIYDRDLSKAILTDVEFIGNFDGVAISGTSFVGSEGAYIDLKTIASHDLTETLLCDANIIDINEKAIVGYHTYYGAKLVEKEETKKL